MTNPSRDRSALIVIDLQVATSSIPSAVDMSSVVDNAAQLITGFHHASLPVAIVTVDLNNPPPGRTTRGGAHNVVPKDALALVPEIVPGPNDMVLTRSGWSAFAGTDLESTLRQLDVSHVVLCGLATNFGVESTARAAYDLGFHVTVAIDAVNSPTPDGHELTISQIFPTLGRTATTTEILVGLGAA